MQNNLAFPTTTNNFGFFGKFHTTRCQKPQEIRQPVFLAHLPLLNPALGITFSSAAKQLLKSLLFYLSLIYNGEIYTARQSVLFLAHLLLLGPVLGLTFSSGYFLVCLSCSWGKYTQQVVTVSCKLACVRPSAGFDLFLTRKMILHSFYGFG